MKTIDTYKTENADQAVELAAVLAERFKPGDVILLQGDLGSGKTFMVQQICRHWQVAEAVTSPTFTLIQHYQGRYPVIHMDLYRLESDAELDELGWEEFINEETVAFIEWPERLMPWLATCYLLHIERRNNGNRVYTLSRKEPS